jgi:DNA repair photolyase
MSWKKEKILSEAGPVDAQFPIIVSASRSTDIPAFYADWFFYRLQKGYSAWTNPFNGVRSYVAYRDTRFIVFWSKDPAPLIPHLDELEKRGIGCYVQYTLNDYVKEGLEKGVPDVKTRISTFKALVDRLGKGHVVWRFDPLVLTDNISVDRLLSKIEHIGDALLGYTEKLVFSFVDIAGYKKVRANLERTGIRYREWDEEQMREFASRLDALNARWGYELATCGERIDLSGYHIRHNRCVDDDLIIRLAYKDQALMDFLGVRVEQTGLFGSVPEGAVDLGNGLYAVKTKNNRDKGQRELCGCIASKDIGEYNTCVHLCEYCYANSSKECAMANHNRNLANPFAETITGF